MQAETLLLLNILRAITPNPDGADAVPLVLPRDSAVALLQRFTTPKIAADVIAYLARGTTQAADTITQLPLLAEQLNVGAAESPARAQQIASIIEQLETINAINQAAVSGGSSVLQHVQINLANSLLPTVVPEWHLHTTELDARIIVVCPVAAPSGAWSVRSRGKSYIERRVSLQYHASATYPLLALHAPSMSVLDEQPRLRHEWQQRPFPDYDLSVYTEQGRRKGRVVTRLLTTSLVIPSGVYTLTLPIADQTAIVATDIFDEAERVLARIVRWPPITPQPPQPITK